MHKESRKWTGRDQRGRDEFKISMEFSIGKYYLYKSIYCSAYITTCILLKLWKSDTECSPGGHFMFLLHPLETQPQLIGHVFLKVAMP